MFLETMWAIAQGGVYLYVCCFFFFFSSRRRHTRLQGDWSSDVCSSDLGFSSIAKFGPDMNFAIEENPSGGDPSGSTEWRAISPHYLQVMHIPVLQGQIGRASCRERV